MWITQSYLNSPEPAAKLHIYYLYEDYVRSQRKATEAIQSELGKLTQIHKGVCILLPQPNSADRIEGEMRGNQSLWRRFSSDLPGLIISREPIEDINAESDSIFFIGLNNQGFSENGLASSALTKPFAENITKLRELVANDLRWQDREIRRFETPPKGFLEGVFEAVELKPGIAGFSVDLKKLFSKS